MLCQRNFKSCNLGKDAVLSRLKCFWDLFKDPCNFCFSFGAFFRIFQMQSFFYRDEPFIHVLEQKLLICIIIGIREVCEALNSVLISEWLINFY